MVDAFLYTGTLLTDHPSAMRCSIPPKVRFKAGTPYPLLAARACDFKEVKKQSDRVMAQLTEQLIAFGGPLLRFQTLLWSFTFVCCSNWSGRELWFRVDVGRGIGVYPGIVGGTQPYWLVTDSQLLERRNTGMHHHGCVSGSDVGKGIGVDPGIAVGTQQ
jgi:hypothetical protein